MKAVYKHGGRVQEWRPCTSMEAVYTHGGRIQALRPYTSMEAVYKLERRTDKLERLLRRATKIIPELRDLSYESRLLECGLITLETRSLRCDQIEVFKIVNG